MDLMKLSIVSNYADMQKSTFLKKEIQTHYPGKWQVVVGTIRCIFISMKRSLNISWIYRLKKKVHNLFKRF